MSFANYFSKLPVHVVYLCLACVATFTVVSADGFDIAFEEPVQSSPKKTLVSKRAPTQAVSQAEQYSHLQDQEQKVLAQLGWKSEEGSVPRLLKSPELVPVPKQTPRKRKYLDEVIPEGTVVSVSPIPTDEERLMLIADEDNEELKGVTLAVPLRDALDFDAEELSYHGEVLARDAFNDLDLKETGQVNVATQRPSSSSNPRIARAHSKIDQLENAITELTAELNAMRMNLTDIEVEETQIAETEETILKEFNTNQYARVAIQKLPLRIAPGDRQSVVTNLPKGTRVRVISKSNSWTRVESDEGLTAWVPSYALQFAK